MDSIVKLIHKKTGNPKELVFSHAQAFLQIDSSYKCADDKYQFINNELIKRPSDKSGTKPAKSKRSKKGDKAAK